jgi:hypothetical protein
MRLSRGLLGGLVIGCLALPAATCQDVGEVVLETGRVWLEVSCANNPQDYCDAAKTLSLTLVQQLREQRSLAVQQSLTPSQGGAGAVLGPRGDAGVPLAVDLVLGRRGQGSVEAFQPISNGAELTGEDELRLLLRPGREAFVYVLSIDGGGVVTPLFPLPGKAGPDPVPAGAVLALPSASGWWRLDGYRGIEHLYVVVALERSPDLEVLLPAFAVRRRALVPDPASVTEPTLIGVGGSEGLGEPFESVAGGTGSWAPQRYSSSPDEALVVTLWFRHD